MKISELIEVLELHIKLHGDGEVYLPTHSKCDGVQVCENDVIDELPHCQLTTSGP